MEITKFDELFTAVDTATIEKHTFSLVSIIVKKTDCNLTDISMAFYTAVNGNINEY